MHNTHTTTPHNHTTCTYRVDVLCIEAIAELGDARRDLVKENLLLTAICFGVKQQKQAQPREQRNTGGEWE
tara:strand:+ start:276 stop:488 length:213 start_codon:yes stop_codon:yes gene_type:complete